MFINVLKLCAGDETGYRINIHANHIGTTFCSFHYRRAASDEWVQNCQSSKIVPAVKLPNYLARRRLSI
jgi:hypothetical protein